MQKTKIDWPGLDYTWNPVIGCRRNCSYCYAKRMNSRFKWIPEWTDPQFFPERLKIPAKVKKPSTWFVGSISDICYWKDRWMMEVLDICEKTPQHCYMFLTKNPTIYEEYLDVFEKINCVLGLTAEAGIVFEVQKGYLEIMKRIKEPTFLSLEPLAGDFDGINLDDINLVIVGADSRKQKPIVPKKEWIDSIQHPNIHYKKNILKYMNL